MQNQTFNDITIIADIISQIARLLWLTVPIIGAIWYFFYVMGVRKQIEEKQKEIFSTKKEIDDMLETIHKQKNGYINQSQLEAITEKNRVPLRAKLETLIMERQFLLDKISILNLIKK